MLLNKAGVTGSVCFPIKEEAFMQLSIVGTNGPLFVLNKPSETAQFLSTHYPQFAKRSFGWQLSVEEVYCLQSGESAAVVVTFACDEAERQYAALRRSYVVDCLVYRHLTLSFGYKLRHGSVFGASYIGYQDLSKHGEFLFFIGPLSDLEQVRAARVAHSVGKTAIMVLVAADESGVTLTRLSSVRAFTDTMPYKKHPRKE